jgi:prepilin-type N-terminal cleavage/methylation domain-containing protein
MNRARGFSLMELLIVVAIILIIAAMAIPGVIHAKISANEASAVTSLRSISTAELSYESAYESQGFAASLASLGGAEPCTPSSETACLIDEGLASGRTAGYNFAAVGATPVDGANTTYVAGAAPQAYDETGIHRFCTNERNVLRSDPNAARSTLPPGAQECMTFRPMR